MKISTFNIGMPKLCIPQKLLLVVKITVLLFFVAIMHVSASSYAQNINLSATNAPLKKLFKEIRKQSGYNFIYTEGMMKDTRPVNIHVSNASIDVILDKVFHDQPLSYTISNNTIVIKEKDNQQTSNAIITITGTVKDEKGEPLPGVTVAVEGIANATSTDYNGKYTIKANAGQTLVFSFIGYKTVKRLVNNESLINVSLEPASRDLTEVVVVGYGTQKRSDITGAVASVPKSRLSELPVTNVLQALEGAVAGVTITNTSSVPGAVPGSIVRGQNSINAGTGPYVVVDGIPLSKTGGSLNDINPNDIASMEILKDASAVAIYGTNGSNGVILITTKRGNSGKPVIRYSGYAGIENLAHILEPRDPASYIQKYADYLSQTGQTQTSPVPNSSELPNYQAGKTIDWVKETTQQGVMQDHNLSVSGGSPDVKYFISGDYMKQKGVVKGYQYNRVSIRSNLDVNVTNFLTVGMSSFFSNNNYDGGRANLLFATAMSPYGNLYNADGTYTIYPMSPELLYTNPLLGLTTDQVNRSVNLNGNGYAEIKFGGVLKGLKYRVNAGYTYLPTRVDSYSGRLANTPLGSASAASSETTAYTIENLLYYNRDIGKHHFDFTGLYSAQRRRYFTSTAAATGFVNDELSFNNIGAGATQTSSSYSDRYALNSQMGRVNYSYNSRYLFTVTARRDGSSVFGANTTKYGVFPSAALGWNISQENFLKDSKIVNSLKLRGSYGKTGNEAISVYQTITTDGTVRSPFNGVSTIGVQASNLGNANLLWETTVGTNIGADFSLFNSRINGSVDAYKTRTSGLLLKRSLPAITGYSSVWDNIGKVANKGIEVTLNTKNIDGRDFRWESNIVYAINRNKIVSLYGDGKDDIGNRWFIGKPISVIYDYKMTGVWQTGEDASKQDPGAKPGDLKFADTNGDGKITADDRVIQGQTTPKWTGGITNTFHYKQFNLSIFIQTAQGMLKNNADLNYADESGRRNTPAAIEYWTPSNGNNSFQSLSYTNTRGYGYPRDASYTRIKDVTFSYVVPQVLLDKAHINGLTFYVSGRNLHTFTRWIGWDPENNYSTRGSGDWTNNYPTTRTFVFGANISLK
ncbi:TonB-dependent receptor [Mucilaginibacter sp. KACC 22773]|uniref:TonB-dependent receptor n=1 Tax=Mucilaginibacter sp. KACC 22773 TaxID=3025671 RepID=UPI002365FA19|nr:TonB-dependent receptor [Mucilaginibacter sp. KACC 22773]WDF78693.1 TonB-dependent receptor [Mucilaginibacter sp. KACC 22773]